MLVGRAHSEKCNVVVFACGLESGSGRFIAMCEPGAPIMLSIHRKLLPTPAGILPAEFEVKANIDFAANV